MTQPRLHTPLNPENPPPRRPVIGLLSNPNSRRNRSRLQVVTRIVANHPAIHHTITASSDDVGQALRDFAGAGVNVVAINGGDGTTARVFTELLEHQPFRQQPAVILLPGGTTNMNVGDVGLTGSLTKAVTRMANWAGAQTGKVHYLDRAVLRAQDESGAGPAYGMFFGVGTIIRGIEYCHSKVHSKGIGNEIGPGIALLRTLWGMLRKEPRFAAPTAMKIALDDSRDAATGEVLLLLISSLERLFLGMHPYWGDEKAALHCTWIQKPAPRLLRMFPSLLRGRPHDFATPERGYFSHNSHEVRLWMDGTYTLDGEMFQTSTAAGPLTVRSGGELTFIRID